MATNVASLVVSITSDTKGLVSGLNVAVAAVGVFAAASVKAAVDYDRAFTQIAAVSNASAAQVDKWREQVLQLSGETARAPQELADALFFLASAGLKSSQIMPALAMSAKAAAVGLGDTADVANIVASALNAYAGSGLTAAQVTDTLVAAVREGRAAPEEFAQAMGRILPIASRAGVSFAEVAGSLSALSNIGLDVNEGVTAMRGLLQALVAPGTQAAEALDKIGISANELRSVISEQGILGGLKLLEDRTGGNIDQLRKIIPNIRALTGELGLMGENFSSVKDIMDAVKNSTGSLAQAFLETQRSAAFQFDKAINDIRIAMVEFGADILPTVTAALKTLGPIISVLGKNLKALVIGFLAFKAVSFLPSLLTVISRSLAGIGSGGAASALQGVALSLSSVTLQAGYAAVAMGAIYTVMKIIEHEAPTFAAELGSALADSALQSDVFLQSVTKAQTALGQLTDRFMSGAITQDQFRNQLLALGFTLDEAKQHIDAANASMDDVTWHFNKAGLAVRNFAGMTRGELTQFKTDVQASMQVAVGQFENLNDAFSTTPDEARKQLSLAVQIARRFHNDLKAIFSDKSLTQGQKRVLAQLPPQIRDAWVRGNDEQRKGIEKLATQLDKLNKQKVQLNLETKGNKEAVRNIAAVQRAATKATAKDYVASLTAKDTASTVIASVKSKLDTLDGTTATVYVKAKEIHGSPTPSELIKLLTKGLKRLTDTDWTIEVKADGKQAEAAMKAAQDQLDAFMHDFDRLGHKLDSLSKKWDNLNQRIDDFKSAIKSGFEQFDLVGGAIDLLQQFNQDMADFLKAQAEGTLEPGQLAPTAPDLGAFAAQQAAQAQQLADVLTKLSKAGLNKDLLAKLAAQGPAGIEFGQQLLNNPALIASFNQAQADIAKALGQTTQHLVSDQFGAEIDHLQNRLEHLRDHFARLGDSLQTFMHTLNGDLLKNVKDLADKIADILHDLGGQPGAGNGHGHHPGPGNDAVPPIKPPVTIINNGTMVGTTPEGLARILSDYVDEELSAKRRRNGRLALDRR